MAASAFYRGYVDNGRRAGQVRRLHIVRQTPVRGAVESRRLGWCGTSAHDVTNSSTVLISPLPACPPEGLTWCPACVGRYADYIGLLGEVAGEVAAYDPELGVKEAARRGVA